MSPSFTASLVASDPIHPPGAMPRPSAGSAVAANRVVLAKYPDAGTKAALTAVNQEQPSPA